MIRLTPMAPILLKNMANPFGKIMRHIVERTAVIVASVCQASALKRISLKLKAVRIRRHLLLSNDGSWQVGERSRTHRICHRCHDSYTKRNHTNAYYLEANMLQLFSEEAFSNL
jgi:hypothetical protein